MTTRYHMSADNIPRICTAQPGNCKVGATGGLHFKNIQEVHAYAALKKDAMPRFVIREEDELKKIHTRFYAFQGAWGEHQLIIVDTKLEREYDLSIKDDEDPADRAKAAVEIYGRVTAETKDLFVPSYSKLGYHSRQCFNRGLGYSEVPMSIEQHPSYVSKQTQDAEPRLESGDMSFDELIENREPLLAQAAREAKQAVEAEQSQPEEIRARRRQNLLNAVKIDS